MSKYITLLHVSYSSQDWTLWSGFGELTVLKNSFEDTDIQTSFNLLIEIGEDRKKEGEHQNKCFCKECM